MSRPSTNELYATNGNINISSYFTNAADFDADIARDISFNKIEEIADRSGTASNIVGSADAKCWPQSQSAI